MKRRLDENNDGNKEKVFSKYKVPLIKKQEQKIQIEKEKNKPQKLLRKKNP